jgi:DUF1680 family protein
MKVPAFSRRSFLGGAAAAATSALLPDLVSSSPRPPAGAPQENPEPTRGMAPARIRPFPLQQVRLGEGPFKDAMEADRRYLHSLPPDRLLHTFRTNAGLSSSAQPLGGWEAPDCELRGHYAGGHYLSASALMYASTGDEVLLHNANTVVAELAKCQAALQSGYLSAFPVEFFDRLRNGQKVWAPFYTIHKIMAGNLDMYTYCGNKQALDVVERMAGWVASYTQPLSYDHMQRVLGTEFGGMGEVLCDLYAATGKASYLEVAQRFDKKVFFDPLAAHRDELKGLHANTHIPQVISAARYYELTGERRYRDISEFFWDEVVDERAYCTGGTSNGESWNTEPGKLANELSTNTTECCCAYNMMRLTRHLFGWSADARYMDYYERVLFNHRLGTINPEDGGMMYYLPLASGYWKTFGKPFDSLWCCTGTGSEEYAKLTDTIYFHDDDSLYVNLYMDSTLHWPEKGLSLRQETRLPADETARLTISVDRPLQISFNLRVPYWVKGGSVKLNGTHLSEFSSPGSYFRLDRVWKNGDQIEMNLPMGLHLAPMPDDKTLQAIMYGPLVLAGRFEPVTREMQYSGDYEPKAGKPITVPDIVADSANPIGWIERDAKQPLTFRTVGQAQPATFVPLNQIIHERYAVYFKVKAQAPGAPGS